MYTFHRPIRASHATQRPIVSMLKTRVFATALRSHTISHSKNFDNRYLWHRYSWVPARSVPPRYWFLVRGRIISVTYQSSDGHGRWRTVEDGRCSISSPNIQYCALASKYVRRYRYANRLHFVRGMLFIWCTRIYLAFSRRVASYEDSTILYSKRLLINVLQYVLQCLSCVICGLLSDTYTRYPH